MKCELMLKNQSFHHRACTNPHVYTC